jgi:hypothetical protein
VGDKEGSKRSGNGKKVPEGDDDDIRQFARRNGIGLKEARQLVGEKVEAARRPKPVAKQSSR